jgi:hypothetical protein
MKNKDLRIGNITNFGIVCEILNTDMSNSFRVKDEDGCEYKSCWADIQPIPLTEDWLIKFGFINSKLDYYTIDELEFRFYFTYVGLSERRDYHFILYNNLNPIGCDVKHVHQLQNLYFALTGEELTQ